MEGEVPERREPPPEEVLGIKEAGIVRRRLDVMMGTVVPERFFGPLCQPRQPSRVHHTPEANAAILLIG